MNINNLPKTKESLYKVKKTFFMSKDDELTYVEAKQLGIDSTKIITDGIHNLMTQLRGIIDEQKNLQRPDQRGPV